MSTDLVPLAFVLFVVTYPSRAIGLLNPAIERMPRRLLEYLQLVGPAVLASLAAVNTALVADTNGRSIIVFGLPWISVAACVGLVVWRKNLLIGLIAAVAIAAAGRAAGWN